MQLSLRRFLKMGAVLLPLFAALLILVQPSAATTDDHDHHAMGRPIFTTRLPEMVSKLPIYESPLLEAPADVGQWGDLMNWPLVSVHTVMLPNGNILMWDVESNSTTTARLWNIATNTFTSVPLYPASLFCSAHILLPDGKVFVNGGHLNRNNYGTNFTHIFSPDTQQWSRITDMSYARWYPSSIILGSGKIITFGGTISTGQTAVIPELFDPATGIWTQLTQASYEVGQYPKTFLMPNGDIFMASANGGHTVRFNIATQTWTHLAWAPAGFAGIMYDPGKILYAGKGNNSSTIDLNASKIAWTKGSPMAYSRYNQSMVVLPDGNVMAIGGSADGTNNPSTGILMPEMWNPTTKTWRQLTPMQDPRMYHSIGMLLPDGRVLSAGGGHSTDSVQSYLTAQIYSPPYLFKGARPTITSAPGSMQYGATFSIQSPEASTINRAVFIRLPSFTHAYDMNGVSVPANFTRSGTTLQIQVPSNPNDMPPGYYYLFIVNSNGVPSVAKIMQIGDLTPLPATPIPTTPPPPTLPPQPTLTPIPTNTPPTPVPTSTPGTGGVGNQTVIVPIITGSDDVNEDGSTFDSSGYGLWIGTGTNPAASYTGLRFANVPIPRGATIVTAQLQVYAPTNTWIQIGAQIAGEAVGNSAPFSSNSRPSARTLLTNARINYSDNSAWIANTWYTIANTASIVQEIISGANWNSGSALSLILRGTGTNVQARKTIVGYEANAYYNDGQSRSARLVITYRP